MVVFIGAIVIFFSFSTASNTATKRFDIYDCCFYFECALIFCDLFIYYVLLCAVS